MTAAEHLAVYAASEAYARAHLAFEHPVTRLLYPATPAVFAHRLLHAHDEEQESTFPTKGTSMTGILNLQTRYRELGRLRLGERIDTGRKKNGKPVYRPAKLETWRFTSTNWRLIARVAELYGGKPERWEDAPGWNAEKQTGVRQFQVTTETNEVPVAIPPEIALSQAMELWSGAKCLRRCDGVAMATGEECQCSLEMDDGKPACKPTTRLNLILPDLPGLGVWRVETKGWFAARELVPMVRLAAGYGQGQVYRLRIDPRSHKAADADGKLVTYQFGVPVLDTDRTPAELYALAATEQVPLAIESHYASGAGGTLAVTPSAAGAVAGSNPASAAPAPDHQSAPAIDSAPPVGASGADLQGAGPVPELAGTAPGRPARREPAAGVEPRAAHPSPADADGGQTAGTTARQGPDPTGAGRGRGRVAAGQPAGGATPPPAGTTTSEPDPEGDLARRAAAADTGEPLPGWPSDQDGGTP